MDQEQVTISQSRCFCNSWKSTWSS